MIGLAVLAPILVWQERLQEFVYVADSTTKTVSLAGSFNNWDKGANPMKRDADGRTWRARLPLVPGKYAYKFVLNGETWVTDPHSTRDEDDGNGNTNSVLLILPKDYATPSKRGDGVITLSAVRHEQRVPDLNWDRGKLRLTVRVRPDDVQSLFVILGAGKRVAMSRQSSDEFLETWNADVSWNRKSDLSYHFELVDGSKKTSWGKNGVGSTDFQLSAKTFKPFEVPQWVEQSVVYQIFPDRFENGDRANDPKNVAAWDAKPTWFNYFGGDLEGVRKRMTYLESLGVGAVYFNPIFASPSNHRYDASDFYRIDPKLGTNQQFDHLTRDLRSHGIRTVIDVSFNHTAVDSAPFKDLLKNQQQSKFKDWFFVKSWPVEVKENPPYVAWFNFLSMPKLNLKNPDTRRHMLGVVDFWSKQAAIGGWRLDVANEVDPTFWQDFRPRVKKLVPDSWIVGEMWGDATQWLRGDQWDASMNYPFRELVLQFIARDQMKASAFLKGLMSLYDRYAPQVSRNQMNLLGSHDTPRFLTLCNGDKSRQRLGVITQFTWVGAPCIYYGDELGMAGDKDPDNRRGMTWSAATPLNPTLQLYRKLISIRRKTVALQSGDPLPLLSDDVKKCVAFGRQFDGKKVAVVVLNRSDASQTVEVPVGASLEPAFAAGAADLLGDREIAAPSNGRIRVSVKPMDGAILVPANRSAQRRSINLSCLAMMSPMQVQP